MGFSNICNIKSYRIN